MHTGKYPTQTAQAQQGAVLAVSLIILLVLTILGITAMRSVSMEEKMASNAMSRNTAFSASESATISARGSMATVANMESALSSPLTLPVTVNTTVSSTAVVTFRQLTNAPNNSVVLGSNLRKSYNFDISSTGRLDAANARTVTQEGIYIVRPAL
jgi:type IV pilus assembly protein PilX